MSTEVGKAAAQNLMQVIEKTKPQEILELVLNHKQFKVVDNNDMSVSFISSAPRFTDTDRILVRMFFPLPSGVELIIEV